MKGVNPINMKGKFTFTDSGHLGVLPITDGQLIILTDKNAMYYDIEGKRRPVAEIDVSKVVTIEGDQSITGTKTFNNIIVSSIQADTINQGKDNTAASETVVEGDNCSAPNAASYAHAEGHSTTASGKYSHSEGEQTSANGVSSHSEGLQTSATGSGAHAEGEGTVAEGYASHAEGCNTSSVGDYSHAEGIETIASSSVEGQHVEGKFNAIDEEGKYAHIIGNGADDEHRSNAMTVDWNGNAEFAGDVVADGVSLKNHTHSAATQSAAGMMSAADKKKLDTLISYGTADLTAGTSALATGTIYCVYE